MAQKKKAPSRRVHAFLSASTPPPGVIGRHAGCQFNLKALISYAQTLERGKFDAFFMADHLAVLNMPMEALKRSATVTSFDR